MCLSLVHYTPFSSSCLLSVPCFDFILSSTLFFSFSLFLRVCLLDCVCVCVYMNISLSMCVFVCDVTILFHLIWCVISVGKVLGLIVLYWQKG